jgi:hypothetical protein
VLIDRSALCANDINSTVGHALRLVQNKPLHCKVPFREGCGLRDKKEMKVAEIVECLILEDEILVIMNIAMNLK